MKSKPDSSIIIIMILIVAIIYISAVTIPVSSNRDLYLTITVEKPLCGLPVVCPGDAAKISDIKGSATGHTLISTPNLASILYSGNLNIRIEAGSRSITKSVDSVFRGTSSDFNIVLKDIAPSQTQATVKLYEDNNLVDTKIVTINAEGQ